MQITDYIESKAIREHLKDHDFNMKEAAWVVWNGRLTMDEQNRLFGQIIETMPDCTSEYGDSFKKRLKKFIDGRIAKYLEITDENDKYVYSVSGVDGIRGIIFDNFKSCFDSALSKSLDLDLNFFTVIAGEKNMDNTFFCTFPL